MKLEKLSAMAELVSSVAIVVTLIYLAVQTQQTNIALHAASREATMMADVTMLAAAIENPKINVNLEKAEITDIEREQLDLRPGAARPRYCEFDTTSNPAAAPHS